MTQAQLELARLGMSIARMQLKTMFSTMAALGEYQISDQLKQFEIDMKKLCTQIFNGEIRGTDGGTA